MKKQFLVFVMALAGFSSMAQHVGIGTQTPHASALLDISSTGKGFLLPRMTSEQRSVVPTPATGLLVYDTDVKSLFQYNGSGWVNVSPTGGLTLPYDVSIDLNPDIFKITNAGPGAAIAGINSNEFGYAVKGIATGGVGYGIFGYAGPADAVAVYGFAEDATAVRGHAVNGRGVDARSTNNSAIHASILQGANANPTILATHAGSAPAVQGVGNGASGAGVSGVAHDANGVGVRGTSNNGTGVSGYSNVKYGVSGATISGTALYGLSSTGYGLEVIGKVKISGGNTNPSNGAVLTSDANGEAVWKNNRIAFGVQGINTSFQTVPSNTWRKVHFASEGLYDYGNNYNLLVGSEPQPTSSCFIVPVNGAYHFDVAVVMSRFDLSDPTDITSGDLALKRNRNGTITNLVWNKVGIIRLDEGGAAFIQLSISRDFFLMTGDIIYVEMRQNNNDNRSLFSGSSEDTYFTGHLVVQ